MDLAREWAEFGGASLALMGASLAASARRRAADAAAWKRQWRQAVGTPEPAADSGAAALYRAAGAAVLLGGLALALAGALGRATVATGASPSAVRALGALIAALGLGAGALKALDAAPFGPRFLNDEPEARRTAGERVAELATWALCALWAGFGFRLLRG